MFKFAKAPVIPYDATIKASYLHRAEQVHPLFFVKGTMSSFIACERRGNGTNGTMGSFIGEKRPSNDLHSADKGTNRSSTPHFSRSPKE
jgi:hypothetical protein